MRFVIGVRGAVVCALAVWWFSAGSALAAPQRHPTMPSLTLGIGGDPLLAYGARAAREHWLSRAVGVGARIVRVNVVWSQVAPVRPVNPANPDSAGYNWAAVDSAVRDLHAHGLGVMLMLYYAPRWAEGRGRPDAAAAGSWRPNPKAFAGFASAAAHRYGGHTADPLHRGHSLPRVRYWQAWNEPNLDHYLSPQRVRTGQGEETVSPALYRQLLNGFYRAVKHVSPSNFVVAGGTTSFGNGPDKPLGKQATAPVAFYRALFCLAGRQALKPMPSCPAVHLDAIDHHPYNARGPARSDKAVDEAAIPDVHRISRVLRAAVAHGQALPHSSKGIWVTELAWSSNPPTPRGVPMMTDAHWYELAFYLLWNQGVRVIMPLEIGDPGLFRGAPAVLQSGLFFHTGKPKPIAKAYKFPFVVTSLSKRRVRAWGRSPLAGRLAIEVHQGKRWHVVRTLKVRRWQVFASALAHRGNSTWRARVGSQVSLTWTQGAYTRR
jgi:hypothetical protein